MPQMQSGWVQKERISKNLETIEHIKSTEALALLELKTQQGVVGYTNGSLPLC
ncbi:MAG: hypothetical protein Q4C78_04240 [Synergistaceae bacterium]|nr:hypothetical protein [Synergistaceae bacterium]